MTKTKMHSKAICTTNHNQLSRQFSFYHFIWFYILFFRLSFVVNSTIPKLRQECELRMITDHLDFLHSDCKEMVSQEKRVDLHNMYVLLKPIPDGLKTLIQAFLDHIKNEGIETISTLKGDTVSTMLK